MRVPLIAITCMGLLWPAASPDGARAQANESSPQGRGEVQAGAGSAGATTGSSGPSEAESPTLPGGIAPPDDVFFGPRTVPLSRPEARSCDLVADADTRRRCLGLSRGAQGGSGG